MSKTYFGPCKEESIEEIVKSMEQSMEILTQTITNANKFFSNPYQKTDF